MWKNVIAFLPSYGLLSFSSPPCPLQLIRCLVRSWALWGLGVPAPLYPAVTPARSPVPSSPTQEQLTPFSSSPVHGRIPIPSAHSSLICQPTCKQLLLASAGEEPAVVLLCLPIFVISPSLLPSSFLVLFFDSIEFLLSVDLAAAALGVIECCLRGLEPWV